MSEFQAASSGESSVSPFQTSSFVGDSILSNGLPEMLPGLLPAMLPGYSGRTSLDLFGTRSKETDDLWKTSPVFTSESSLLNPSRTNSLTSTNLFEPTSQDSLLGTTSNLPLVGSLLDVIDPNLTLTSIKDDSILTTQTRLSGVVDGTGSAVASLTYHFNNRATVPVTVGADGSFDQAFDVTGLEDGYHTLTLTAKDAAGNTTTTHLDVLLLLSPKPPSLNASLVRDTAPNGATNADRITSDATISGVVKPATYGLEVDLGLTSSLLGSITGIVSLLANNRITEFKAGIDDTPSAQFVDVLSHVNADGGFTFDQAQLDAIYGAPLPDGSHTLHLQAKDSCGGTQSFELSFVLDRVVTPTPILDLDADSDSGLKGDRLTSQRVVTLVGQTEANTTVVLNETGATTTADAQGNFEFTAVPLTSGLNTFTVQATDDAGNVGTSTTTFYQFSPPTAVEIDNATVAENSDDGTVIGRLTTLDPDESESHTYVLDDDAEGRFQVVGDELQVAKGRLLDFEQNQIHYITIRSIDTEGLSVSQVLAIQIANVNEVPTFTTIPITTAEDGSLYRYDIVTTDPDAGDRLTITAASLPKGLTLVDNGDGTASLYGTPTLGDYDVDLTVTDAGGLTSVQSFTLEAAITMVEDKNFTVVRPVSLKIPQEPSILSFKISPTFDRGSRNTINDAVEVALVDAQGRSLVHTISPGRDTFFNWTEGQDAATAAGVSYNAEAGIVRLNLTGIPAETAAKLIFRLVNDDQDTTTQVRIEDLVIATAPEGTVAPVQAGVFDPTSGTTNPRLDITRLEDVSASFKAQYYQTSFNDDSNLLYTDVAVRNIGTYSTNVPLIVAIKNISDPSIQVRHADGFTADGLPYYDFSHLVQSGKLGVGDRSGKQTLTFYNPNGTQFTYELVMLTQLNEAPTIKTEAVTEVIQGRIYRYDVDAVDRDGDVLSYRLAEAPARMAIDAETGKITWDTTTVNNGSYVVSVEVSDGRGGLDQQTFNLSVTDAPANRPPLITSTPVVSTTVAEIKSGRIIVANDEWALSDIGGFRYTPTDAEAFANNIANLFTGGRPGSFLGYSDNFGLRGTSLRQTFESAGHIWTTTTNINFNLKTLLQYDGVFIGEIPADNQVLIDYVNHGGNVYLLAGTESPSSPAKEAELWNSFLKAFGLSYDVRFNGVEGNIPVGSSLHPLFMGVKQLYQNNGKSIIDLDTSEDQSVILTKGNAEEGLYAVYDPRFTARNAVYQYKVEATDADTDALAYSLKSAPSGMWIEPSTGILRWAPTAKQVGKHDVTVTVEDGKGGVAQQSFRVLVQQASDNHAPIVTSEPVTQAYTSAGYTYQVEVTDPDEDLLLFSLIEKPAGMTIDPLTGEILWASPVARATPYDVTVKVTDGRGGVTIQSYQLQVPTTTKGEIRGTIWRDVNGNGIQDTGERGLAETIVYLDTNGNRSLDFNELAVTTNNNGHYTFSGLDAGTYTVRQVLPEQLRYTFPIGTLAFGENIIQNGSFEQGPHNNGYVVVKAGSTLIPGWNVELSSVDYCSTGLWQASDGIYSLDLDGSPGPGGVTQTLSTVPGQTYLLSFDLAAHGYLAAGVQRSMTVSAAGQSTSFTGIASGNLRDMKYKPHQWQFTATGTTTELGFYSYKGDSYGPVLDNVMVRSILNEEDVRHVVSLAPGQVVVDKNFGNQVIESTVANQGPTFTTTAFLNKAIVEQTWKYQARAADGDFDALTYDLLVAPDGMVIDSQTGLVAWTPTAKQARRSNSVYLDVGTYTVLLRVQDGKGGVDVQSFEVTVQAAQSSTSNVSSAPVITHEGANHSPIITSIPSLLTNLEGEYQYDLTGFDPDGDSVLWILNKAPDGMSIDPMSGTLRWQPQADQIGLHDVSVHLIDSLGGFAEQTFALQVNGANSGPSIYSTPITSALQGEAYSYKVVASDPEDDVLTFSLGAPPAGMTIDKTGLISWIPQANQIGAQTVEVRVTDTQGLTSTQIFTLQVGDASVNYAPKITSTPVVLTAVGQPYTYRVQASDQNSGDTLSYRVLEGPEELVIDSETGVITWTTPSAGEYQVVVGAEDSRGLGTAQSFALTVRDNQAPVLQPAAMTPLTVGAPYRYDVRATDADGDRLSYKLDAESLAKGIRIDTLGRLQWTPTAEQVGAHTVRVTITDALGAKVQQQLELTVLEDTAAPLVNVTASQTIVQPGAKVTFWANATDNVGVASLQLLVNGETYALDTRGLATVVVKDGWSSLNVEAIAKDAVGNTGRAETLVRVNTPNNGAPLVSLDLSTIPDGIISSPTSIFGSVQDPDNDPLTYKLEVAPVEGGAFRTVFEGTGAVLNDTLGTFDPSLLLNDSYIVQLTASDGIYSTSVQDTLSVEGDLKLGNFRLSFTDLSIPVSGIPVMLTRTYDSMTAQRSDDFGFGWRMEFRDTDLRTSLGRDRQFEEFGVRSQAFDERTRVYITLPGGKREAFTFKPEHVLFIEGEPLGLLSKHIFEPKFVAEKGSTSTLTVEHTYITKGTNDKFYGMNSSGYNPADAQSGFGGVYVLTTKEGTTYRIDAETGDLLTVTDTNGNMLTYTDAGVTSSTGKTVTFNRDAQGRIVSVQDPMGYLLQYKYDAKGDLVRVIDREGNSTNLEYKSERPHYLDKIIDPLGREGVETEYDENGRLKYMIDAQGQRVELGYDPANSQQTVYDQLGNPTTYVYDERGNILTEVDAVGKVTTRVYDENNNVLSETVTSDRTGTAATYTITYTYDGQNNKLTEADAFGKTTYYTYGKDSRLLTETNALGQTTTYTYDSRGNLISTKDAEGQTTSYSYIGNGNLTSFVDANGQTTKFQYDADGFLKGMEDALGHPVAYTYDANGNRTKETRTVTTLTGEIQELITTWKYDREGRVTQMTDAEGHTTKYEYDATGKQTAVIDALNRRTEYLYDERGQLVSTIMPDETPSNSADNPRTITLYDRAGRERAMIDPAGRVTHMVYDEVGRLVETIHPQAGETLEQLLAAIAPGETVQSVDWTKVVYPDEGPAYLSDNDRRRTEYFLTGEVKAEIDERGNRTEFRYDDVGRLVETIYADDTPETLTDNPRSRSTYDAIGRRIAETDALNHTTTFIYDEVGRLTETRFHNSTLMSTQYDSLGRRQSVQDQNGNVTEYRYDALGRLTGVKDALQHWTEYEYDELGRLIEVEDANDHATRYEYDKVGRRIATILPLGQRAEMTYDAVGNLQSMTDFNGETTTYVYDAQNRLVLKDFEDDPDVYYTYTLTSQIQTITDGRGITTFTYNERDWLMGRKDPKGVYTSDGYTIEYQYDAAGNRTAVETPSGTTAYTYNERNWLETVTDPSTGTTTYVYDVVGNLTQTQFPNGVTEIRQYNDLNQLIYLETSKLDAQGNKEILTSYTYTLDKVGHRLSVTDHTGRLTEYTYDDLYRLEQEKVTVDGVVHTTDFSYDNVGNRIAQNDSIEGTTTYTYDDNDRLLTEVLNPVGSSASTTTYNYDDNGNTTIKTVDGQQTTYTWNDENRLVEVETSGGKSISYTYDTDGIRASSTVDGAKTDYLVDKNLPYAQVLEEYVDEELTVRYVHGNDLISQERGGTASFYLVDGLGSTTALTDASGNITDHYIYGAFGNLSNIPGSTENSYRFAGEQFDENLNQYYLRERYYSSDTGRFTRRDTFEGILIEPVSLHKYLYTHANPANATDPSGLFTIGESLVTTRIAITLESIKAEGGLNFLRYSATGEELSLLEQGLGVIFASLPLIGGIRYTPRFKSNFFGLSEAALEKQWLGDGRPSGASLRKSLIAAGQKYNGEEAHHIVPGTHNLELAIEARSHLAALGFRANEAANGVFLSNAMHHGRGLHSNEYYRRVWDELKNTTTRGEAERVLGEIAQKLKGGTFMD